MSWTGTYFIQDNSIFGSYPLPIGAAEPFVFDLNGVYSLWMTDANYYGSYPFPARYADRSWPRAAYWQASAQPVRQTRITGVLTLTDGTVQTLTDEDLLAGSLAKQSQCCTDTLCPGAAPSAEYTLTLLGDYQETALYGASLSFSYWLYLDSLAEWYEIPLGTMFVAEASASGVQAVELVGYDAMRRMDTAPPAFTEGKAYTPYELIQACCDAVDIPFAQTEAEIAAMPNGEAKFQISGCIADFETARDLLIAVSQLLGGFVFIDRFDRLNMVSYAEKAAVCTVTERQRMGHSVSALTYQLLKLQTTAALPDLFGVEQILNYTAYSLNSTGVTAEISENPLWKVVQPPGTWTSVSAYVGDCLQKLVQAIDLRYRPYDLEIVGEPALDLWDFVQYPEQAAPITGYRWRYHGRSSLSAAGREAIAGVMKTQTQKRAESQRRGTAEEIGNVLHTAYAGLMGTHEALQHFTNAELSHFTHSELGGKRG